MDDMVRELWPGIIQLSGSTPRAESSSGQNHTRDRFEIWEGKSAWFWRVANNAGTGAAIGIALSREEAEKEARSCIDERSPWLMQHQVR
jgi:hypothetical protein